MDATQAAEELHRLRRDITRSLLVVCGVIGVILYVMLSQTADVRADLHLTRDSVLTSLQEAKDSASVQRARLRYRLDSLSQAVGRRR